MKEELFIRLLLRGKKGTVVFKINGQPRCLYLSGKDTQRNKKEVESFLVKIRIPIFLRKAEFMKTDLESKSTICL